jgi:hypothetical protein
VPPARPRDPAAMSIPRLLLLAVLAAAAACAPAHAAGAGACAAEKFSGNRAFAACADLARLGASLHWSYDAAAASLSVAFLAAPPSAGGWVAWGLNPRAQSMDGTQALVAVPSSGGGGAYEVQTYSISGTSLGAPGPLSAYRTSGLAAEVGGDGRVRVFATLVLPNGTGAEVNHVWQVGPYSGGIQIHDTKGDNMNAKGTLNLLTGATAAASGGGSIIRKKNVSWSVPRPQTPPTLRLFALLTRHSFVSSILTPSGQFFDTAKTISWHILFHKI